MPTQVKKSRPEKSSSARPQKIASKAAPGKARSDSSPKSAKASPPAKSKAAPGKSKAGKPAANPPKMPAKKAAASAGEKKIAAAPKKNPASAAKQEPAVPKPAAPAKSGKPVAAPIISAAKAAAAARAAAAAIPAIPDPAGDPEAQCYFLLLSSHERKGRRFIKLKANSVLTWFQRAWRLASSGGNWNAELGGYVHGLDNLSDAIGARRLPMPVNAALLQPLLTKYISVERDLEAEPHFVHAETDDDETEIEYFIFDDVFLASGEALDRLPSPQRRPKPIEVDDEEESPLVEELEEEDDDDPYTQLINRLADE